MPTQPPVSRGRSRGSGSAGPEPENRTVPSAPVAPDESVTVLDALEQLAFALVSVTNRAVSERGGDWQLTFPQWRTLVVLGAAGEGLRVSDLGSMIHASASSASRIVQRLAEHGLVEIGPDRRDGRVVRVRMTGQGTDVFDQIVARRRALIEELIGRAAELPASRELAWLASALEVAT